MTPAQSGARGVPPVPADAPEDGPPGDAPKSSVPSAEAMMQRDPFITDRMRQMMVSPGAEVDARSIRRLGLSSYNGPVSPITSTSHQRGPRAHATTGAHGCGSPPLRLHAARCFCCWAKRRSAAEAFAHVGYDPPCSCQLPPPCVCPTPRSPSCTCAPVPDSPPAPVPAGRADRRTDGRSHAPSARRRRVCCSRPPPAPLPPLCLRRCASRPPARHARPAAQRPPGPSGGLHSPTADHASRSGRCSGGASSRCPCRLRHGQPTGRRGHHRAFRARRRPPLA